MGFLEGYRIVDLSGAQGALAGRMLADLGAEVIVVEPPEGASARRKGRGWETGEGHEAFAWTAFARSKKSIVLDYRTAEGADLLDRLCRKADAVLMAGTPGEWGGYPVDPARLAAEVPTLVVVTITPFGIDGPKAGWQASDLVIWAASGAMTRNRVAGRRPLRIGAANQAWYHAAGEAAVGALLALFERASSGLGQRVDISAQDALVYVNQGQGLYPLVKDKPAKIGSEVTIFPTIWKTQSGFVHFTLTSGPATGHFSNAFMAWMRERGHLPGDFPDFDWRALPQTSGSGLSAAGDPRAEYAAHGLDEACRARLTSIMETFFASLSAADLLAAAHERRLLLSPILSVADILRTEHFHSRGSLPLSDHPAAASQRVPGPFARIEPAAFADPARPPSLGADSDDVTGRWLAGPAIPQKKVEA